uniref:Uncharacterized protein n=1 Tax=Arundo donax TaxID=35708 RepID=A0A0A8Z3T5_ARUDO
MPRYPWFFAPLNHIIMLFSNYCSAIFPCVLCAFQIHICNL